MYCKSFNSARGSHAYNPSLTSSIHNHQNPPSPSTNSSFHKNNFPGLLIKSSHLTNFGLSSKEVPATPFPRFFHHSPSLSPIPPSKSPLFLSAGSYRNIGDPVGAWRHLLGSIRTSCRMTYSGMFWGRFVENESTKIGEDPYLPPKPSYLISPSLTHLPHHQEDLAFTFSQKRTKRKQELFCSFRCRAVECLAISNCMLRIVRMTHMLAYNYFQVRYLSN